MDIAALGDCAESRVALLGAAERARVLVTLALVAAPQLLLVDDLSGGPDAVGRTAFVRFLARVAASGVAVLWSARAIGAMGDATAAYRLDSGRLKRTGVFAEAPRARKSIELDVPAAARAAAALARRVHAVEHRGQFVRVPLDGSSAEEVLALCRDLAIPVRASRVVRER
jgi:ABC-type multidrug transport system ATPase subunit